MNRSLLATYLNSFVLTVVIKSCGDRELVPFHFRLRSNGLFLKLQLFEEMNGARMGTGTQLFTFVVVNYFTYYSFSLSWVGVNNLFTDLFGRKNERKVLFSGYRHVFSEVTLAVFRYIASVIIGRKGWNFWPATEQLFSGHGLQLSF